MVALLYQCGLGVEQDVRKAKEWLIRAAEQNSPLTWNNLGSLYALRLPRLSCGPEAAMECYRRAKELGFRCADHILHKSHTLRAKLTLLEGVTRMGRLHLWVTRARG
jgi:TPR repeat protein